MASTEGLGRLFNVVPQANGVHIPLRGASGVTFVCFEDDGSQVVTLKESVNGLSEQNLAVISKVYKAPGVGGTWTKVTQNAAATFDLADDTTNDAIAIYVGADQLSDGFDCVELTNDGGNPVIAIIHDLHSQRAPERLPRSVV
ncbi:hypothetical protein Aph01nite_13200 [Acrocarpospora phusangensis]|uniref:Uncharacterized protein n=1 Tax=Acrocarpospora phusangensis TaxID=1070424 RepID=A0A919Q969_9ACTN|nr:hypothetical protein [Acrocarpospora phusangensis]GIH23010.1 hypothetical protein Aph01nite_13200 [Acrocarpospora phusangensis]